MRKEPKTYDWKEAMSITVELLPTGDTVTIFVCIFLGTSSLSDLWIPLRCVSDLHLLGRTENFRAEIENKGKGAHKRHQEACQPFSAQRWYGAWLGVAGIPIMLLLQRRCHDVSNVIQNGPNEIKQDQMAAAGSLS